MPRVREQTRARARRRRCEKRQSRCPNRPRAATPPKVASKLRGAGSGGVARNRSTPWLIRSQSQAPPDQAEALRRAQRSDHNRDHSCGSPFSAPVQGRARQTHDWSCLPGSRHCRKHRVHMAVLPWRSPGGRASWSMNRPASRTYPLRAIAGSRKRLAIQAIAASTCWSAAPTQASPAAAPRPRARDAAAAHAAGHVRRI